MFVANNHALFHLWLKQNLKKCQQVSKYFFHDCLQNFLLLLMFLLTASIVQNSHSLVGIYFIFLKEVLGQT